MITFDDYLNERRNGTMTPITKAFFDELRDQNVKFFKEHVTISDYYKVELPSKFRAECDDTISIYQNKKLVDTLTKISEIEDAVTAISRDGYN